MAVTTLLSLPKDVLTLIKESLVRCGPDDQVKADLALTTLGSHVAFSQLCRALRDLNNLSNTDSNDFKLILRKCGVGKPAVALLHPSGKKRAMPTWTQLACGVAKHAQGCKRFQECRQIAEADPSSMLLTILPPTSPVEAKDAVQPSYAGQQLNGDGYGDKIQKHDTFSLSPDVDEEGGEYEMEGLSSHLAAACSFATTAPINSLQLIDFKLKRLDNSDGITCADFASWLQLTVKRINKGPDRVYSGWYMVPHKEMNMLRGMSASDAKRIAENDFAAMVSTDS